MRHPYDSIPELAGIASYDAAARGGYSVAENVRRLLQYQWTERRLMQALVAHIPSMPIWEAKCAMALHQWQFALHVDALRERISEMRSPVPNLDAAPQGGAVGNLDRVLDSLEDVTNAREVLHALYARA